MTDLKNYELICLRYLDYNLDQYTAYNFLELFLKNGIVFEGEISMKQLEKLYSYNLKIINNFIKDQRYFDFNPLQIACAIVRLSREVHHLEGWPNIYERIYKIRGEDFMNCYFVIKTIYHAKFSNFKTKTSKIHNNQNQSSNSSFVITKNKKTTKTFNSPYFTNNTRNISSQNFNEDNSITQGNSQLRSNRTNYNGLPPIPTYTPNYFNPTQYKNNNEYKTNDYYANNKLNHLKNFYSQKTGKVEKNSYINSSDNNDLNSTVDEIVESKNLKIQSNFRSARIKTRQIFENFDVNHLNNLNKNISPFNIDGLVSYNNILSNQNFPDSINVYNNYITTNPFVYKSHTSFNNCNNGIIINKFYLDNDRQILPAKNVNWLN